MESAPVPPHERPWRHPSELAADQRAAVVAERPNRVARFTALGVGVVGITAVSLAVLALSPDSRRISDDTGLAGPEIAPVVMTTLTRASDRPPVPLATPVRMSPDHDGDAGAYVVAPARSVAESMDANDGHPIVSVKLVDGTTVPAEVLDPGDIDGLAMLWIASVEGDDLDLLDMAELAPDLDDMVTVMTADPVRVSFGRVRDVGAEPGTAIVDTDGRLVGVCFDPDHDADGVIPVGALLDATTTSTTRPPR